ncbi:hypothetical protein [Bordetella trematum]|uniref:hypothetical protein n=1 Tax=Bordetella trematum TaxID=123899 RepID=UPI00398A481F
MSAKMEEDIKACEEQGGDVQARKNQIVTAMNELDKNEFACSQTPIQCIAATAQQEKPARIGMARQGQRKLRRGLDDEVSTFSDPGRSIDSWMRRKNFSATTT